jgi:hypothetical protein
MKNYDICARAFIDMIPSGTLKGKLIGAKHLGLDREEKLILKGVQR